MEMRQRAEALRLIVPAVCEKQTSKPTHQTMLQLQREKEREVPAAARPTLPGIPARDAKITTRQTPATNTPRRPLHLRPPSLPPSVASPPPSSLLPETHTRIHNTLFSPFLPHLTDVSAGTPLCLAVAANLLPRQRCTTIQQRFSRSYRADECNVTSAGKQNTIHGFKNKLSPRTDSRVSAAPYPPPILHPRKKYLLLLPSSPEPHT